MRMRLRNHACNCATMQTHSQWSVSSYESAMGYVHDIKDDFLYRRLFFSPVWREI